MTTQTTTPQTRAVLGVQAATSGLVLGEEGRPEVAAAPIRKQGPPKTSPVRPGAKRSADAMHAGKRAAAVARFERYRHLTRDLGWQRYRARQEMGLSAPTVERYERELRKTDPPAQPRQVGPARPTKSRTTPRGQETGGTMAYHKARKKAPDWGWQDRAACKGEDITLFFGPDGERQADREIREWEAKQVCAYCPVRMDCRDYAVDRPERYGTWGEQNEDERASERRRRMRRASAA